MLPYVILGFTFVFDTFFLFKLYYFYKVLPFIIIPLLYSIFKFLIKDLITNLGYIEEDLIITHCFLHNGKDNFNFKIKPGISPEEGDKILLTSVPEYLFLYPLKGFYESCNIQEAAIKKYFLMVMYSCYFISCSYILYQNIILFYI